MLHCQLSKCETHVFTENTLTKDITCYVHHAHLATKKHLGPISVLAINDGTSIVTNVCFAEVL
jgi:hypothetical protein